MTLRLSPKQSILTYNIYVFAISKTSKQLHMQNRKKMFSKLYASLEKIFAVLYENTVRNIQS